MNKHTFKDLQTKIEECSTFTLLMHNNPDGDCISSMFALKYILEKLNKTVFLAIHNQIPENYNFWFDKYTKTLIIPKEKSQCLIILDTPVPQKTYKHYNDLSDFVITIDHHKTNSFFGDLNIHKTCACTGLLLYEFTKTLNIGIDKTLAEYLYISICWDTDGFKNSFATSQIYKIASELISKGAVPQRVHKYLFEYNKQNELEIQRFLLNKIIKANNFYSLKLNKSDMQNLDNIDIYKFLKYIKSLETIELFVLLIEREDFVEVKLNNNKTTYLNLKKTFGKLFNIPIKNNFEYTCNLILSYSSRSFNLKSN